MFVLTSTWEHILLVSLRETSTTYIVGRHAKTIQSHMEGNVPVPLTIGTYPKSTFWNLPKDKQAKYEISMHKNVYHATVYNTKRLEINQKFTNRGLAEYDTTTQWSAMQL